MTDTRKLDPKIRVKFWPWLITLINVLGYMFLSGAIQENLVFRNLWQLCGWFKEGYDYHTVLISDIWEEVWETDCFHQITRSVVDDKVHTNWIRLVWYLTWEEVWETREKGSPGGFSGPGTNTEKYYSISTSQNFCKLTSLMLPPTPSIHTNKSTSQHSFWMKCHSNIWSAFKSIQVTFDLDPSMKMWLWIAASRQLDSQGLIQARFWPWFIPWATPALDPGGKGKNSGTQTCFPVHPVCFFLW